MADLAGTSEEAYFQSLSAGDKQLVKEFVRFSARSETQKAAAEHHLMTSLRFAFMGRAQMN